MIGLFILSKDIYSPQDQEGWDLALNLAQSRWDIEHLEPSPQELYRFNRRESHGLLADIERWAVIYVCYRELVRIQGLRGQIIMIRNHYDKSMEGVTWDGDLMIVTVHWDGTKQHGHLIYKTVQAFGLLDFDYYVRSGLSSLIDLHCLERVMKWRNVPTTKFYGAPFWDASDWSYGAFVMCSKDIKSRMITHPDPRWYTEPYPDDMAVPWAAWDMNGGIRYGFSFGSECRWNTMDCTYKPNQTYFNRFGFSASDNQSTDMLIEICNRAKQDKMFFFRANSLVDHNYVKMYKYFLKIILGTE
jgi:hypothetical protein